MHYLDYTDFNFVGPAFKNHPLFIDFQKKLQNDINAIVNIITHVPAYDQYWDTKEGKSELLTELKEFIKSNNNFDSDFNQTATLW